MHPTPQSDEAQSAREQAAQDQEALVAAWAKHPLGEVVLPRRLARMAEVLAHRLTSLTVVLENLYDPHNVSAVVRSAEGFGLDALHVVEKPIKYRVSAGIVRGAHRWVEIHRHQGLTRCLADLQSRGFLLAAADVGPQSVPLHELPVGRPLAVILGSEHDGLSRQAKGQCDLRFTIPMHGFTESFNVSASAAIALYDLSQRRRQAIAPQPGELTFDERYQRGIAWLRKTVRQAAQIEARAARAGRAC